MPNLFVYGTLLFPELVSALTQKSYKSTSALLKNYRVTEIFDGENPRSYPALIPMLGAEAKGKLLFDVDEKAIGILDFYEGDEYEKININLSVDGANYQAITYAWIGTGDEELKGDWNPNEFESNHLSYYLKEVIPEVLEEYQILHRRRND